MSIKSVLTSSYAAKLLLFGEHIVLKGAQALAMPLPMYGGQWRFAAKGAHIQYPIMPFVKYVRQLRKSNELQANLQIDNLAEQVAKGLYFDSTIPIGYGLGSSGAFVAGIYDQFSTSQQTDIIMLRRELAQLESYFHGASSGTDPLICYLRQPLLINSADDIAPVELPNMQTHSGYTIFILNTGIKRQTQTYVNLFLNDCKDENYQNRCASELMPLSNEAIAAFLQARWDLLYERWHQISLFQLRYFDKMIPDAFRQIWLDGLSDDVFKLKLCGAGGGGFILGMTDDFDTICQQYPHCELNKVYEL